MHNLYTYISAFCSAHRVPNRTYRGAHGYAHGIPLGRANDDPHHVYNNHADNNNNGDFDI